MGCASSKKRTTSIDDLTGQAKNKEPAPAKGKNGQVATNDVKPIKKESSYQTSSAPPPQSDTSAIQIPGTHKSFLAPDGIPFIDEDIDDDAQTGGKGDVNSIPADNAVVKPDVNKNIVKAPSVPDQQPKEPVPPSAVAVQKDVDPPTVPVSEPPSEPSPAPAQTAVVGSTPEISEEQAEKERERAVAMEILSKELDMFTASEHNEAATSVTVTECEPVAAENDPSCAHHDRAVTPDDQEKAAVKIQAGIRGYRDRQRVKALRAAKETAADDSSAPAADIELHNQTDNKPFISQNEFEVVETQLQDPEGVNISVEFNETNPTDSSHQDPDESDDPEKQRAATKIQASFKGYKTRKELGKIKK